ncbi:LysM peptidoglycan-binding domain-containing M23 family metallopeptidase [Marinithermus hydrothermalis]|uniref:Peptidase M23 n=1 Tax=Marinithermus hydrothermalis (strain DSM 14884 / JCM 11576 / T1) TaxID=869210 RepID=F2NMZ8_MARHT|nr:M23 family metallopeptidase [Marinithermus hydrothermalis]AEB12737.1 Peptidase M23 [Marinithermus hydrothermalis DSM 14884]
MPCCLRWLLWLVVWGGSLALAQPAVWYEVQPGDTLYRIAQRYGTTIPALVAANRLEDPNVLAVGQRLRIPGEHPWPQTWPAPIQGVRVTPHPVVQGQAFGVRVALERPVPLEARFQGVRYPLAPREGAAVGVVAVGALTPPGVHDLEVTGPGIALRLPLRVVDGGYAREVIRIPPSRSGLLEAGRVRAELERVRAVCAAFELVQRWRGPWRYPVQPPVRTSRFGTRRAYNGGPYTSYHAGTDLKGAEGAPVYAPADGVVALAEPLEVRGNAVILRHGLGVCSGYGHLSRLAVRAGQVVRQGEVLGYVGQTGLVTGPHLHWEVRVRGVPVDPEAWVVPGVLSGRD